ncbi:M15 family metallopeptidase [Nitratireductor aquimarinus]|uniref:M15 family metallopeptidase n=1 Tax=Nitratireductor aquimarinus TaxID=889300 RepID=UPI002936AFCC|nr:M15 family metallopeptidase [Nitratireductor aquimarinus]MDV2964520.1 M15 family metallopeptidase [Nitratireductor aquimarinus]
MSAWDWSPYLVGGGLRPDAMTGLDADFNSALVNLFSAAPEDIRGNLRVTSAYRSPEVQQKLFSDALAKYGSEAAARKWVAPPGKSRHNHGGAVDLKYLNDAARQWAHDNASAYGLHFPMGHEPWHIEMAGSRGKPLPAAGPQGGPAAAPTGLASMFGPEFAEAPSPLAQAALSGPNLAGALQRRADTRGQEEEQRRVALADMIRF